MRWLAPAAVLGLALLGIWLLYGGLGLSFVETREWGGLMLTVFLAVYSGLIAIPLGILLALGRQSRLPVLRLLSIACIEFWRGVPIITVIFLASLLLPLILPFLLAAWIYVFVLSVRELGASVFLVGPGTHVLGTISLTMWEEGGSYGAVAALGVLQILPLLVIVAILPAASTVTGYLGPLTRKIVSDSTPQ